MTQVREIVLTSAGLTTAVTAYTSGDQVGTEFIIAGAANYAGGWGAIQSISLIDTAKVLGAVDFVFFNAATVPAADNAPAVWTAAAARTSEGVASLVTLVDVGSQRIGVWTPALPFQFRLAAPGTSLFMDIITRSANSFFTAVGDITIKVMIDTP